MRVVIVAYTMAALGMFIWFMFSSEYFEDCEFNAGSCATTVTDFGLKALVWPAYVMQ